MRKTFLSAVSLLFPGRAQKARETLFKFTAFSSRFRYFTEINGNWEEIVYRDGTFFTKTSHSPVAEIKACIVTYRNGQVVHQTREFESYPSGISWLMEEEPNNENFSKAQLTSGNDRCKLSFSSSPVFSDDPAYYETRITNTGAEKVRVLRFAGFQKTKEKNYRIHTFTGDFFSASDFNNWYMDSADAWISPGEFVSDPVNYGGKNNNWAYEAESESGEKFWFGEIN